MPQPDTFAEIAHSREPRVPAILSPGHSIEFDEHSVVINDTTPSATPGCRPIELVGSADEGLLRATTNPDGKLLLLGTGFEYVDLQGNRQKLFPPSDGEQRWVTTPSDKVIHLFGRGKTGQEIHLGIKTIPESLVQNGSGPRIKVSYYGKSLPEEQIPDLIVRDVAGRKIEQRFPGEKRIETSPLQSDQATEVSLPLGGSETIKFRVGRGSKGELVCFNPNKNPPGKKDKYPAFIIGTGEVIHLSATGFSQPLLGLFDETDLKRLGQFSLYLLETPEGGLKFIIANPDKIQAEIRPNRPELAVSSDKLVNLRVSQ